MQCGNGPSANTMHITLLLATLAVACAAFAAQGPYDESANAEDQVASAVREAAKAKVPVLVVFGANWCGDCKVLDHAFKQGAAAPLIAKNFRVVKVDVGRFDKNVDIASRYGVRLKTGIPAVAVLDRRGRAIYATKAGELADARNMGDTAIYDFFSKVSASARVR